MLGVYHPSRRFEIVSVDVLKISPTTDRGNKKVVVIGDAFTRFMWAFPVSEESMAIIARVLLDQLILRFGVPEKLLSDRGTSFTGNLIQSICTLTGMKKIFTTAYHPQTNGMVERFNKTLCRDLSAYVTLEVDWDLYVSLACFRYNTSVNAATKVSPYKAMFGVSVFNFDNEIGWALCADDHKILADEGSGIKDIHEILYCNGDKARHIAARSYNNAVKEVPFSAGDCVIVFSPTGEKDKGKKLRIS